MASGRAGARRVSAWVWAWDTLSDQASVLLLTQQHDIRDIQIPMVGKEPWRVLQQTQPMGLTLNDLSKNFLSPVPPKGWVRGTLTGLTYC